MKSIIFTLIFISLSFCSYADDLREFNISGKTVIYFSMTQAEYDSKEEEEQSELVEILSDFYYYRGKMRPFLKENEIRSYETTDSKLILKQSDHQTTYQRQQLDHVVGLIMADQNKKPKVILGVMTDIGLKKVLSKYFNIQPN